MGDVFLAGPRAQLEEERRKLRKKEMEQAKAWDEIHSYRDRLERAKKKLEYEKTEQDRKFAQIDTLRLSFERKETELIKKQRKIDEGNKLLQNAKSQLQKEIQKIKNEKNLVKQ